MADNGRHAALFFGGVGLGMVIAGEWAMQVFGVLVAVACLAWLHALRSSPQTTSDTESGR